MTRRTVIRQGWIVSVDPRVGDLRQGDLLIEDGRIAAIAPQLAVEDAEHIDARGMIVLPGFIDTHRHTWQTCVRHRYADIDPQIYFAEMLGAKGAAFRTEDVYTGTLLGAVSALDGGITTMMDWSHVQNSPEHSDAAVQALRDAGLRAVFGHGWPLVEGASWMFDSRRGHPQDIRRLRRGAAPRWRAAPSGWTTCAWRANWACARASTWAPTRATRRYARSRRCTPRARWVRT